MSEGLVLILIGFSHTPLQPSLLGLHIPMQRLGEKSGCDRNGNQRGVTCPSSNPSLPAATRIQGRKESVTTSSSVFHRLEVDDGLSAI
jgi:hypothetical protein